MRQRLVSDDELMQATSEGDHAALTELMRRHRGWVNSLARAFVHSPEQAEDLTQEVFCRVHQHAGDYATRGQFVAWLKRIAINLAKDFLRKQRQATPIPLHELQEEPLTDNPFDPTAALLSEALRDEVRTAIQSLPDEQRLTLIMRFFGNMSVPDISWAMQCPEGTVKSRLFHGLRRVRENLAAQWRHEGEDNP